MRAVDIALFESNTCVGIREITWAPALAYHHWGTCSLVEIHLYIGMISVLSSCYVSSDQNCPIRK